VGFVLICVCFRILRYIRQVIAGRHGLKDVYIVVRYRLVLCRSKVVEIFIL